MRLLPSSGALATEGNDTASLHCIRNSSLWKPVKMHRFQMNFIWNPWGISQIPNKRFMDRNTEPVWFTTSASAWTAYYLVKSLLHCRDRKRSAINEGGIHFTYLYPFAAEVSRPWFASSWNPCPEHPKLQPGLQWQYAPFCCFGGAWTSRSQIYPGVLFFFFFFSVSCHWLAM